MRKWLIVLAVVIAVAPSSFGQVTISTVDPYPIRGELTDVMVEDDSGPVEGAIIQVEYRPNSSTARTETLLPTDASGTTEWTPAAPGLARLSVTGPDGPTGTVAIAVRFVRFPASGIAIMMFAGLFLFGGAGYGISLLLRERKVPGEEPPST